MSGHQPWHTRPTTAANVDVWSARANSMQNGEGDDEGGSVSAIMWSVLKASPLILIMITAAFGNVLVIASVVRTPKLRVVANTFIVSLAVADLLVALLVMPFNASQLIAGTYTRSHVHTIILQLAQLQIATLSQVHDVMFDGITIGQLLIDLGV